MKEVVLVGIVVGFVGDSLNRNMFVSLFCSLRCVAGEVKKWRSAGSDRVFTFLKYNFAIAYHRTNLLARYGRLVTVLADLGQRGGILRLVGKVALLWGGIRGSMSLIGKLITFPRLSKRPLFQRILGLPSWCLYCGHQLLFLCFQHSCITWQKIAPSNL